MKNILKNRFIRRLLYFLIVIIIIVYILDSYLIPWYVNSPETVVPNVVGMNSDEAIDSLENLGFDPMIIDTVYGEAYQEGTIFLQKPGEGKVVKEGRNIYLFVSGGAQVVSVPKLIGKTRLDAKFALERLGLKLGRVTQLSSDKPEEMIFDQQFAEGTLLKKGESVDVTVSAGRTIGSIYVPNLVGKSLAQAERIIADSSLTVGKINYQISTSLLPNTVLDQYPSSGNTLNPGDKIDLFVTQTPESRNRGD